MRFTFDENFINRWSHGKITQGLIYEGIPDDVLTGAEKSGANDTTTPRKRIYRGASASQTVAIQSVDAFLGIEHTPSVL